MKNKKDDDVVFVTQVPQNPRNRLKKKYKNTQQLKTEKSKLSHPRQRLQKPSKTIAEKILKYWKKEVLTLAT